MSGQFRYAFDIKELGDGIGIVPVAVGLFGLGEILSTPAKAKPDAQISRRTRCRADADGARNGARRPHADRARLGAGLLVGIVPGSAHIISSFHLLRAGEAALPKHPGEFGKGAVAGVAGPESANNAASTGAFVPMLALGPADRPGDGCADGGADDARRAAGPARS